MSSGPSVPSPVMADRLSTPGRDAAPWRMAPLPVLGDLPAARAYCREIATRHYENFTVATWLVPARLRQHLANVYAFARWADDLADETPRDGGAALSAWRDGLEACFAGRPMHPVYVALGETVQQTGLTIGPFADLLSAFEEDKAFDQMAVVIRYDTRAALLRYCSRSANPVGRIVLALEGCRDRDLMELSDAICTGLQLVNFWQDLRRDRDAGRVYLPREDLVRHGVEAADLDAARASPALCALVHDEVVWARTQFDAGEPLARRAPAALRPAIDLFLGGGRAVADAIERAGYDTLARRPIVSGGRKLGLAWWALWRAATARFGGRHA